MKFSNIALAGAALQLATATPVEKRDGGKNVTDADVLQYALTLEHLEASFYEEGMKNYTKQDFMDAGVDETAFNNLKMIAMDEKAHEQFLTQALTKAGAKPVERCTYQFTSTDAKSFLALGNILEGVGVSAYLGAAASIMNKEYLTAAGSILTVEARHSAYLRSALGESPSPQPFDNPLDFNEVYTVASPFIASCPDSNAMLPVKAFPSLTAPMKPVMAGDKVDLMVGEGFEKMKAEDVHAAFITVTGPVWAKAMKEGDKYCVTVPKGVTGQSYVVLTNGNKMATDDNIVAGPAILEVSAASMMKPTSSMSGSMMSMSGTAMPTPSWAMGASAMDNSGSGSGMGSSWGMMPSGSMASPSSTSPVFTGAASSMTSSKVGGLTGLVVAALGYFL